MARPKQPAASPPASYDPAALAGFARQVEETLKVLPVRATVAPEFDASGVVVTLHGLTPEQAQAVASALQTYGHIIIPKRRV